MGVSAERTPSPASSLPVAPGILLRYLQEQNRPYSAQDVFGNLQREHGLGKAVRPSPRIPLLGTPRISLGFCPLEASILA